MKYKIIKTTLSLCSAHVECLKGLFFFVEFKKLAYLLYLFLALLVELCFQQPRTCL